MREDPRLQGGGYTPASYGTTQSRQGPPQPNYFYAPPTAHATMPTPPVSYYTPPVSNYKYSPLGYQNPPQPSTTGHVPESESTDEAMPDIGYGN